MKHEEKTVKEVEMHNFSVCAYKSQDFAQSHKNLARSHDHATVTFRVYCHCDYFHQQIYCKVYQNKLL